MKHLKGSIHIGLVFITLFLAGCASAPVKVDENPPIEEVRISEFILGPGDTVDITIYRNDDLHRTVKIDMSGKIMFPLIGDVQAGGVSIFKLRDEMTARLSRYLKDPQITINISTVQSQKVMVLGQVNSPGVFTVDSSVTMMEAIAKAGGATQDAKLENVLLIRRAGEKAEVKSVNISSLFAGKTNAVNSPIQGGDIVYVPSVMIADVSWYFSHLGKILSPVVNLESGIVLWPQAKNVLTGKEGATTQLSIPAK